MIDILKSMAIFSKVAHFGSFRTAATALNVSPSVISRHVSSLESTLGEVLLNRSTRRLALTSAGEGFLVHCDRMLESANQGLAAVEENANQGHLRITLPITLITTKFGDKVRTFRERNPHVKFSFIFDDENIDIIGEGIDVALRLGPLEDSNLKARLISTVHRSIVCTPDYLSKVGDIVSLEDLNRCTWIGRKNPASVPLIYSPDGEMYTVPGQPQFVQVNNVEAVKAFVLSHNGVGLFSDMLVERELADGKLLRLLPDWKVKSMKLFAAWSAQRTTGQLVKKFVGFLAEELNDL